jgi:hypothetical protein
MVLPASALLFIAFLGSAGPPGGCPVEPSRYAVLAPGDVVTWREGLSASEYPLATADIENAECLLLRQVDAWNAEMALDGGDHIEPADYYRQYCVLRDKEGHRILYLNAFCAAPAAHVLWRDVWLENKDGGSCYFQVLFDLTTGRVLEFNVNGEA